MPGHALHCSPRSSGVRVFQLRDHAHACGLRVERRGVIQVRPVLLIDVNGIVLVDDFLCSCAHGHNTSDVMLIFLNLLTASMLRYS